MTDKVSEKLKISPTVSERNWDEVFRLMPWWDSERIASAIVMVVGAGALGNEVLKNLALLNVGRIIIVDFDVIEYSNLSRSVLFNEDDADKGKLKCKVAMERTKAINSNVQLMAINGDIGIDVGLGVFRRVDVVVGCLDNRLARLWINRNCFRVRKMWIDGAIENLAGQLNVYKPDVSCYECQLTDTEWENIRFRLGCPDVARRNTTNGRIATTPIAASIIGAMQAQEALKVIYHNDDKSLAGKTFQYEGMNNMILLYDSSPYKENCDSHYQLEDIIEAPDLSNQSSVAETISWCQKCFTDPQITLQLDHELVLEISSRDSEKTHSILKAKPHLSDTFLEKLDSGRSEDYIITDSISSIDQNFIRPDLPLSELGIPPLHILQIETHDNIYFVELSADVNFLNYR